MDSIQSTQLTGAPRIEEIHHPVRPVVPPLRLEGRVTPFPPRERSLLPDISPQPLHTTAEGPAIDGIDTLGAELPLSHASPTDLVRIEHSLPRLTCATPSDPKSRSVLSSSRESLLSSPSRPKLLMSSGTRSSLSVPLQPIGRDVRLSERRLQRE